jgi:hypothetical protein
MSEQFSDLGKDWSRPWKIVRVLQAIGMDVPLRLRRERLTLMVEALQRSGIEASLADGSPIDSGDSPGIEAKVRLRRAVAPPAHEVLFGYIVVDRFVSGGMSRGFKVCSAEGDVRFLKMVPVSGVDADALRREQDIYSKLERASAVNVLRVYDFKRDGDSLALVTEFADGGSLAEHVEKYECLAPAQAKAIALSVLGGLRELHSLQIVSRDLKPANVLRVGQQWKLCDFGISKNLGRLVTHGKTFQRAGTEGYTAPEQWDGTEAHPTADIFSFGKLLVFLLTGETDVDRLWGKLPPWGRLARKCAEYDPEARPSLNDIEIELKRL